MATLSRIAWAITLRQTLAVQMKATQMIFSGEKSAFRLSDSDAIQSAIQLNTHQAKTNLWALRRPETGSCLRKSAPE